MAVLLVPIVRLLRSPPEICPGCGAQNSMRWEHQNIDGSPDRRRKANRRACATCGHVADTITR